MKEGRTDGRKKRRKQGGKDGCEEGGRRTRSKEGTRRYPPSTPMGDQPPLEGVCALWLWNDCGLCKMNCNKTSQKQKTQKLIQNQILECELFEYEPVQG